MKNPKDEPTGNRGLHEHEPRKSQEDHEADLNDQDPGHRQKENQNQRREDPLAS